MLAIEFHQLLVLAVDTETIRTEIKDLIYNHIEHIQHKRELTTLRPLSNLHIHASNELVQEKHILWVLTSQNVSYWEPMFSSGP